jgi:hypothetical protein
VAIVLPGVPSNYLPTVGPIIGNGVSSGGDNGGFTIPHQAPTSLPLTPRIPNANSATVATPKSAVQSPYSAQAQKAPAKPQSPLQKWLAGDTTYQQQLAEFNKSKSDYQGTYNTQVSQTQRDYNQTQRQMNLQAQQDRMNQQNDFAGRGILHSGVYAKALGDYNDQFSTQMNNLTTGENDKLGDLSTQRNSFLQELMLQMNAAKQDAIRRRAEQLGL